MIKKIKPSLNPSSLRIVPFIIMILWATWANAVEQINSSAYRIGAGDIILLAISAGGEEQDSAELLVSNMGDINVPFIGKMKAAGLTMSELEAMITKPLAQDFFVDPQVHIQMKEFHSLQFFISGAVAKPGMFELNFNPTVMDLIAKAGGVTAGRGNIAYVLKKVNNDLQQPKTTETTLTNSGKTPVKIDLVKLLDQGNMGENIKLASGDTVYIPLDKAINLTQTKVYVEGEVEDPGVFDYQPGLTALRACIMAGGFARYAAPNRTKIIRNSSTDNAQEIIKIDLEKVKVGEIPDFPLKPGDRIHVPETWL